MTKKTRLTKRKGTRKIGKNPENVSDVGDADAIRKDESNFRKWWHTVESDEKIYLTRLRASEPEIVLPITQLYSVQITATSRDIYVGKFKISEGLCPLLAAVPQTGVEEIISALENLHVCPGNPDPQFFESRSAKKGRFKGKTLNTLAVVDDSVPSNRTIRSTKCSLLVSIQGSRCAACQSHRNVLRRQSYRTRAGPATRLKYAPHRILNTPERQKKLQLLAKSKRNAQARIRRLVSKIDTAVEHDGVAVEPGVHEELQSIVNEKTLEMESKFPFGSFRRLFWEQQKRAAAAKGATGMRWHPLMIKWALHLGMLSSAAYHATRTAGFIAMPSERTLRDYIHVFPSDVGFNAATNAQLMKEAKIESLTNIQRHVVILFDEMKIKEDLVFDKNSGSVVGVVKTTDVNDKLLALESSLKLKKKESEKGCPVEVATHMLAVMVRGLVTGIRFPYAHFPTTGITAASLHSIIWEAVRQLETIGFYVIAITCDGAASNRRFYRSHWSPADDEGPTYKVINKYSSNNRWLYFFCDVPHLVKTTRNCLSHSFLSSSRRSMMFHGKPIIWDHIRKLYELIRHDADKSGLKLVPKLSLEHIELTSYSRMRVDLAAQVLSSTVADAIDFYKIPEAEETTKFIRIFDKAFDCLNCRSVKEKKADRRPYRNSSDERLDWLENYFLGYLKRWRKDVEHAGVEKRDQQIRMLSKETSEGWYITVRSFVELVRYIFSRDPAGENLYFLSGHLNQDAVENYFGNQRARGGRCDNPTVKQFIDNAASLRMQGSLALDPVRGNSSRKRLRYPEEVIDDTPLPRRSAKKARLAEKSGTTVA